VLIFNNDDLTTFTMMLYEKIVKTFLEIRPLKGVVFITLRLEVCEQGRIHHDESWMR